MLCKDQQTTKFATTAESNLAQREEKSATTEICPTFAFPAGKSKNPYLHLL